MVSDVCTLGATLTQLLGRDIRTCIPDWVVVCRDILKIVYMNELDALGLSRIKRNLLKT